MHGSLQSLNTQHSINEIIELYHLEIENSINDSIYIRDNKYKNTSHLSIQVLKLVFASVHLIARLPNIQIHCFILRPLNTYLESSIRQLNSQQILYPDFSDKFSKDLNQTSLVVDEHTAIYINQIFELNLNIGNSEILITESEILKLQNKMSTINSANFNNKKIG